MLIGEAIMILSWYNLEKYDELIESKAIFKEKGE